MRNTLRMLLLSCTGLALLLGAAMPQAQASGDGPPLRIYYCFHVIDGQSEPLPYASVGPTELCPPVPESAQGHNKTTPTEHDCWVDRNGGEV